MRAVSFGGHGRGTACTGGAQDRRRRRQHCPTTPPYAAPAFRCGESYTQLDFFGPPTSVNPLLGLAVRLPHACRKCAGSVATVGPGTPPHYASLRCRSCDFHRGWLSRANCTFLTEVINKGGAPREPIVLHTRTSKPEPDDDGVSAVHHDMKKD
jgi:hypothetical protein